MRRALLITAFCTVPFSTMAQIVGPCDDAIADIRNVDWSQPSRTFANGAVRVVQLDTAEPAAAAVHLAVLLPHPDEPFQACRVVSAAPGTGFLALSLDRASATYDPARGLTLMVPGLSYDGESGMPLLLPVTVNQSTGEVSIP